jgi:hypothetical protein
MAYRPLNGGDRRSGLFRLKRIRHRLTCSTLPIVPPRDSCMLPMRPYWYAAQRMARWPYCSSRLRSHIAPSLLFSPPPTPPSRNIMLSHDSHDVLEGCDAQSTESSGPERSEHAVISTFDLFSIGGKCSRFLWLTLDIINYLLPIK